MKIVNCKLKIVEGFTLAEFLIVLAIVVVLAGITVPVFMQLQPGLKLSGAVRDLVTNLRYTQQITVTEQVNYCLQLFPGQKKYQIIQCSGGQPLSEFLLPSEIATLDATGFTNNRVEFNPYGSVKESGTISLKNTNNKTKTVEVKPSGFVRITN